MEEGTSSLKMLTGNRRGKEPFGRHKRRREDNINMDLKEIVVNTRNRVD